MIFLFRSSLEKLTNFIVHVIDLINILRTYQPTAVNIFRDFASAREILLFTILCASTSVLPLSHGPWSEEWPISKLSYILDASAIVPSY